MSQYAEFSFALPVKMYENTATPGIGLDQDWAYNRIKEFETKACRHRRWQKGDTTRFQHVSTIAPGDLKILNYRGIEVDTIAWSLQLTGAGFKVWELNLNLDAAATTVGGFNPVLYLYQRNNLLGADFKFISEPIEVRESWPNTLVFSYTNSKNDFGLFFTTGLTMNFRIEAGLMDYKPDGESADFVDELHDVELLSATPFDSFKLYIGDERGVAEWEMKVLNFIIHCDYWTLSKNGVKPIQYVRAPGAKWDINRVKGYPLIAGSIDVLTGTNLYAIQQSYDTLMPGLVTGYNLITNFFGGPDNEIEITEITEL